MWDRIKKILEVVDGIQKVIDLAVLLASLFLPFLAINSTTLRWCMFAGAFVGGVLGYYFTVTRWGGKGPGECLKRRTIYIVYTVAALLITAAMIAVLRPEAAELSRATIAIREFFLRTGFLPNVIAFAGALGSIYWLVGAITLSSSKLWTTQP